MVFWFKKKAATQTESAAKTLSDYEVAQLLVPQSRAVVSTGRHDVQIYKSEMITYDGNNGLLPALKKRYDTEDKPIEAIVPKMVCVSLMEINQSYSQNIIDEILAGKTIEEKMKIFKQKIKFYVKIDSFSENEFNNPNILHKCTISAENIGSINFDYGDLTGLIFVNKKKERCHFTLGLHHWEKSELGDCMGTKHTFDNQLNMFNHHKKKIQDILDQINPRGNRMVRGFQSTARKFQKKRGNIQDEEKTLPQPPAQDQPAENEPSWANMKKKLRKGVVSNKKEKVENKASELNRLLKAQQMKIEQQEQKKRILEKHNKLQDRMNEYIDEHGVPPEGDSLPDFLQKLVNEDNALIAEYSKLEQEL